MSNNLPWVDWKDRLKERIKKGETQKDMEDRIADEYIVNYMRQRLDKLFDELYVAYKEVDNA